MTKEKLFKLLNRIVDDCEWLESDDWEEIKKYLADLYNKTN